MRCEWLGSRRFSLQSPASPWLWGGAADEPPPAWLLFPAVNLLQLLHGR